MYCYIAESSSLLLDILEGLDEENYVKITFHSQKPLLPLPALNQASVFDGIFVLTS